MLIFIFVALAYLAVGTVVARVTYRPPGEGPPELKLGQHKGHCYWGVGYQNDWRTHHCDCGLVSRDVTAKARRADPIPTNPYLVLFGYPAIYFHSFITGGGKNKSKVNRQLIANLERELGMHDDA